MSPQRILNSWRSAPIAIFGMALLILVGGFAVILQNEATYSRVRVEQTQGLADILAASAAAAVDFDDPAAAQQAVNAFSANNQVQRVGIYRRDGTAIAGYRREALRSADDREDATRRRERHQSAVADRPGRPADRHGLSGFQREAPSRRIARYPVLAGLLLLAVLVVMALGLAQAQLRKANRELAGRAEALAQSNALLEEQIEERAKAEEQLRQSQKMQALGQLTGGIAHDFNNLLTVIQGSGGYAEPPRTAEDKRIRFAQAIVQAATNAASLTSQLLAFARRQPLKPEQDRRQGLIVEMAELIQGTVGERIKVGPNSPAQLPIEVDRAQLQSALLNIASNAETRCSTGGSLTVRTAIESRETARLMIAITLADTVRAWTPRRPTEYLSRSSPPRGQARAPASALARYTASPPSRAAKSVSTARRARAPA